MAGMNHIVRTFYYQVLHLLAAGVHPIFVFDGPQKPVEKGPAHPAHIKPCIHVAHLQNGNHSTHLAAIDPANARSSVFRDAETKRCEVRLSHVIPLCRAVLDHLGVPHREAPAESEAECAALEKLGKVDAVLARDGDAFVFGSRRVLRKLNAINQEARSSRLRRPIKDIRQVRGNRVVQAPGESSCLLGESFIPRHCTQPPLGHRPASICEGHVGLPQVSRGSAGGLHTLNLRKWRCCLAFNPSSPPQRGRVHQCRRKSMLYLLQVLPAIRTSCTVCVANGCRSTSSAVLISQCICWRLPRIRGAALESIRRVIRPSV
ncbi:PIN domain-like protein [Cercophora newfieldiana]|uniref:PIN domain-like protein n=1 Tax=Cercophora newfieldiana TaxID=92897 RepID=A0AA39Y9U4_9PEZI|nr:PIN domain-like protein [Cercophora newfieldiana]